MDQINIDRVMELLIEYFETGNTETDSVAKLILRSSPDYTTFWQEEINRIQAGTDWTGIRSVEAEILAFALHELMDNLNKYKHFK